MFVNTFTLGEVLFKFGIRLIKAGHIVFAPYIAAFEIQNLGIRISAQSFMNLGRSSTSSCT